jgi:hypothetical protein
MKHCLTESCNAGGTRNKASQSQHQCNRPAAHPHSNVDQPSIKRIKGCLGPLMPFTFWAQYEAVRSVGKWTGKADYNLLRHSEGVDNRLEVEQVCMSIARQMSNTLFVAAIPP